MDTISQMRTEHRAEVAGPSSPSREGLNCVMHNSATFDCDSHHRLRWSVLDKLYLMVGPERYGRVNIPYLLFGIIIARGIVFGNQNRHDFPMAMRGTLV